MAMAVVFFWSIPEGAQVTYVGFLDQFPTTETLLKLMHEVHSLYSDRKSDNN